MKTNMENVRKYKKNQIKSYRVQFIQYALRLTYNKLPLPLLFFLIAIETLQLISIGIPTSLKIDSIGLKYFGFVSHVLYPQHYLTQLKLASYLVPVACFLSIFHSGLFIYTVKKQSRLVIIVHYLLIFINTILAVPFILVSVSILSCSASNPFTQQYVCFSGYHLFLTICSVLTLLWLFICTLFAFLFYTNQDPFRFDYFSTSSNLWIISKFIIKIAPIIFLVIDYELKYYVLYSVSYAAVNIVYFGSFKFMWPIRRYCRTIQNFVLRCDVMIIIVTTFFILLHFFEKDPENVVFPISIGLGLLGGQFCVEVFEYRSSNLINLLLNMDEQEQQEEDAYIQFFFNLIRDLDMSKDEFCPILHLIKIHEHFCTLSDCVCLTMSQKIKLRDHGPITEREVYQFVNELIQQICLKKKKNFNGLKLIQAFLFYKRLDQKVKAVHLVSQLLSNKKINLKQQIAARTIQFTYRQSFRQLTDFKRYADFAKSLYQFQIKAKDALNNCQNYWIELVQQDCQPTKVWKLANALQEDKQELQKIVDNQLLQYFPCNVYILELYISLLLALYQTPKKKLEKYIHRYTLAVNQFSKEEKIEREITFRQNEQLGVLCAAQMDNTFQFIRVSNNIVKILKYKSEDLINKSINLIIPEIYQQFHDTKLKQYLQKDDNEISQRSANLYSINGQNKVASLSYVLRILPNQTYGLQLVCFIKENKSVISQKLNYLSYYYQNKDQNNQWGYKSGDIIHIDPFLKDFIYGRQQQQSHHTGGRGSNKMCEIVPEWDLSISTIIQFTYTSKFSTQFSKISLVHQDELQEGTFVKYLLFWPQYSRPRLTIDPMSSGQYSYQKSKKQDFFYPESNNLQNSYSKLYFRSNQIEGNQKKNNIISPPTSTSFQCILAVFCVLFGLVCLFCILSFILKSENISARQQDFEVIKIINKISINFFVAGIQAELPSGKEINGILKQNDNLIKRVYEIMTIRDIDSQVYVPLSLYVAGGGKSYIQYSLNNGASFLKSNLLELAEVYGDAPSLKNVNQNINSFYENSLKVIEISRKRTSSRIQEIKKKQIGFESAEIFIAFFLTLLLFVRVVLVLKFSQLALCTYSERLTAQQLNEYIDECKMFGKKLKGEIQKPLKQLQKIKLIVKHIETLIPQDTFRKKQATKVEQQQRQKLVELKNKITFEEGPNKINYLLPLVLTFLIWGSLKIFFSLSEKKQSFYSKEAQNRQKIRVHFETSSQISRLIFFKSIESTYYNQFALQLEENLMEIAEIGDLAGNVHLEPFFQILLQLKYGRLIKNSSDWDRADRVLIEGQDNMDKYIEKEIEEAEAFIGEQKPLSIFAIGIIMDLVLILILLRICYCLEQIRKGAFLMMQIIKNGFQKQKPPKESRIVITPSLYFDF